MCAQPQHFKKIQVPRSKKAFGENGCCQHMDLYVVAKSTNDSTCVSRTYLYPHGLQKMAALPLDEYITEEHRAWAPSCIAGRRLSKSRVHKLRARLSTTYLPLDAAIVLREHKRAVIRVSRLNPSDTRQHKRLMAAFPWFHAQSFSGTPLQAPFFFTLQPVMLQHPMDPPVSIRQERSSRGARPTLFRRSSSP